MTRLHAFTLALVCPGIVAASCAKTVQPVAPAPARPSAAFTTPPPPPPPPPPRSQPVSPPTTTLSEDEIFGRKSLDALNGERPLGDAFFDFDASSIREDARPILQKNAEWLRRWNSTRISIEGHSDDRGTSEYNLALGERRANAVKEYLVSLGVAADRLLAVGKGEESPVCFADDESCWQQNRRGHAVITAK